jgi:hypothetical protein
VFTHQNRAKKKGNGVRAREAPAAIIRMGTRIFMNSPLVITINTNVPYGVRDDNTAKRQAMFWRDVVQDAKSNEGRIKATLNRICAVDFVEFRRLTYDTTLYRETPDFIADSGTKQDVSRIECNSFAHEGNDERPPGENDARFHVHQAISRINHSCRPMAFLVHFGENDHAKIVMERDIDPGTEITIDYLPEAWLQSSRFRQGELSRGWRFDCEYSGCCTSSGRERNTSFRKGDQRALGSFRVQTNTSQGLSQAARIPQMWPDVRSECLTQ